MTHGVGETCCLPKTAWPPTWQAGERRSASCGSDALLNLRSSTWGKFVTVLQTSALGGPITSTRRRLHSRHHTYTICHCIGCVGDTRDFLLFGCRVDWERPSSSYASYGLINLRSSTWGKFSTVLQTSALGGPTTSTRRRLRSRHHALFWRRCRGG